MTAMLMAALTISKATKIIKAVRIGEPSACRIVWIGLGKVGNLCSVEKSRGKTQASNRSQSSSVFAWFSELDGWPKHSILQPLIDWRILTEGSLILECVK